MPILPGYSYAQLRTLGTRLRAGAIASELPAELATIVAQHGALAVAAMTDCLADEREANERRMDQRLELVWSGPELDNAGSRDTPALVRQLFKSAERFVLISGYAVYEGAGIFDTLAQRIRETPGLECWIFLNVARAVGDVRPDDAITREFAARFYKYQWRWEPRPRLFHDPRSLERDPTQRAVLHAKCIVIDECKALVTSANLTEAAYYRNIECGVLVNDAAFAKQLSAQFMGLIANSRLREISL